MGVLTALFGETGHVTWQQECLRSALVFAYGLLAVRVAGRRVFGKYAALDIIVSVIVGSSLSRAVTGGAALFGTMAATTVMLVLHWLLAQGAARFRLASALVEGSPVRLVSEGKADLAAQRRWSISEADLKEALRSAGVSHAADAREITLEPSGKISVLK